MLLVGHENVLISAALDDSLPQASSKLENEDLNLKTQTPQRGLVHNIWFPMNFGLRHSNALCDIGNVICILFVDKT